jgi:hypothetical protein
MALGLALGISAAALLAACDNGPSAVGGGRGNDRVASSGGGSSNYASSNYSGGGGGGGYGARSSGYSNYSGPDHRKDEVKVVEGKPMWAPSRQHSAEENVQRAFDRNGASFDAKTIDQYVKKAHAFVGHPPAGTLTLTRPNGDTLYYDPKANVFAVANKDGAPRTMFKPDDGADYWEKQKDQVARAEARSSRRSRSSDDAG